MIFAAQAAILYLMETAEQRVMYGHVLDGLLWLGGPIAVGFAAHAVMTVVIAVTASKALQAFADATVQALNAMRALALSYVRIAQPAFVRIQDFALLRRSAAILRRNGERAPPILSA